MLALVACGPTPCVEVPCLSDAEPISRDAGVDAFARPDARRAPIDAGRDAAPYGEERWAPLVGVPSDCQIEIALEPSALPLEVGWEACGEGCERWTGPGVTWSAPDASGLVWIRAGRNLALLDIESGAWRSALRESPRGVCSLLGDIDAGRPVVAVAHRPEARTDWIRVYDIALDDPSPRLRVHAPLDDDGFVLSLRFRAPRLAFATTEATWTLDPRDAAVRLGPNPWREPMLGIRDTEVLFTSGGHDVPYAFVAAPWVGAPRTLHETLREITGVVADDDGTFAWVELTSAGSGLDWTGELWTATYDGSTFTARLVRSVPAGAGAALGAGLYGRAEDSARDYRDLAVFYRLADGARASFSLDGGATGVVSIHSDSALLARGIRIDPRTLVFE